MVELGNCSEDVPEDPEPGLPLCSERSEQVLWFRSINSLFFGTCRILEPQTICFNMIGRLKTK